MDYLCWNECTILPFDPEAQYLEKGENILRGLSQGLLCLMHDQQVVQKDDASVSTYPTLLPPQFAGEDEDHISLSGGLHWRLG